MISIGAKTLLLAKPQRQLSDEEKRGALLFAERLSECCASGPFIFVSEGTSPLLVSRYAPAPEPTINFCLRITRVTDISRHLDSFERLEKADSGPQAIAQAAQALHEAGIKVTNIQIIKPLPPCLDT